MEFAECGDLSSYADQKPLEPINVRINWVVQILDAIDFLHKRGIVHLDIKPLNVVKTAPGTVKVFSSAVYFSGLVLVFWG